MTGDDQSRPTHAPVLKLTDIRKSFGSVHAVVGISLEIARNEVVGLVGENGAGKSTLIKILTGIYQPDGGSIEVDGKVVRFRGPRDAVASGIGVVHQEQSLFTNLSVAENIEMNAVTERGSAVRFGFYRWGRLNKNAAASLARIGSQLNPKTRVGDLPFVDRQMVEIARAIRVEQHRITAPLVILDEPTSLLERTETAVLEREIGKLKDFGSVIFVSHRLDEVMRICDRIIVMRHGKIVADRRSDHVTEDELFKLMVGRESHAVKRDHPVDDGSLVPVFEATNLTRNGKYRDVSFSVLPGRLTAIIGATGSGRESLARAIFGAEATDGGTMSIGGVAVHSWSVTKAVAAGVGYVPAERKVEGMVGALSAAENITLTHPGRAARGPILVPHNRARIAQEWFETLDVRPNDSSLELDRFSGGNQQKVVMEKWLNSPNLKILVLDHPLRGLDPGASQTVNEHIRTACAEGAAVILLADTLEEALDIGDDIIVMRDGEVSARFNVAVDNPSTLDLLEGMV